MSIIIQENVKWPFARTFDWQILQDFFTLSTNTFGVGNENVNKEFLLRLNYALYAYNASMETGQSRLDLDLGLGVDPKKSTPVDLGVSSPVGSILLSATDPKSNLYAVSNC